MIATNLGKSMMVDFTDNIPLDTFLLSKTALPMRQRIQSWISHCCQKYTVCPLDFVPNAEILSSYTQSSV